MALINCRECRAAMSDEAAACPTCGAPNRDRQGPKRFKWWLWTPLALVGAFFAIGALTPNYVVQAQLARERCERDNAAALLGNPDLCKNIAKEIKANKGCPPEAPNCSWGGK